MDLSSGMTPIGNHAPGGGARFWKVGDGRFPAKRFKMWSRQKLTSRDGTDCGEFYKIVLLPVSPRVNGAEGFGFNQQTGEPTYYPSVWLRAGFKLMSEFPKDGKKKNAKAQARRKELNKTVEYGPVHELAKSTEAAVKAMEAMVRVQAGKNAPAVAGTPDK